MTYNDDRLREEDIRTRKNALDIRQSFLIQAPAGSGKTALLIQRYLALLAHVAQPEHILAMTFTRKAAGEMNKRILEALRAAREGGPVDNDYDKQTRHLAEAALAQDVKQGWRLIEQPSRINVMTIDAFCMRILRQTPILNRWGMFPRVNESPQTRFADIIDEALCEADAEEAKAWETILGTLDNNAVALIKNLEQLLAKREQWLPIFYRHDLTEFRALLEQTLTEEITQELSHTKKRLLAVCPASMFSLMRNIAKRIEENEKSPDAKLEALVRTLTICAERGELPEVRQDELCHWKILVDWLLNKKGKPRKTLTRNEGFFSKKKGNDAEKEAMRDFLDTMLDENIAYRLHRIRLLPSNMYSEQSWKLVEALLFILLRLYARYQTNCARDGVIDFTEVLLSALNVLIPQNENMPSDLLLLLDMRIEHLLIDEFQDTSIAQKRLIEALISGWQPDDGRTLFAVGDPMQSIYQFRQAEVGIFLEAQENKKIGDVPLRTLSLTRNFRSDARLVDWCNDVFSDVFPQDSNALSGAVVFQRSAHERKAKAATRAACVELFTNEKEEAGYIAEQVEICLKRENGNIALLVRSRSHLRAILPALRERNIDFSAVNLDKLTQRGVISNLAMLTRTLIQPNDEIAWMTVLRAPWCGLMLEDYVALARARIANCGDDENKKRDWRETIHNYDAIKTLSEDGQKRLSFLLRAWRAAYENANAQRLTTRVYDLWLRLNGDSCIDDADERFAAKLFFDTLEVFETSNDRYDWSLFMERLDSVFLPENEHLESSRRVKVMTLHQAKGLEFDVVMIPCLTRSTRKDESSLLRWRQRANGLLLAARETEQVNQEATLGNYLKALAAEEQSNELIRLMYVGATRARDYLLLTGVLEVEKTDDQENWRWKEPPAGSMMALGWQALRRINALPAPISGDDGMDVDAGRDKPFTLPLLRLSFEAFSQYVSNERVSDKPIIGDTDDKHSPDFQLTFNIENYVSRQIGILVHRRLASVGIAGGETLRDWLFIDEGKQRRLFAQELVELGVPETYLDKAIARAFRVMRGVTGDAFAQWMLDPAREDAHNEWTLSMDEGKLIRIDRYFIDQGIRWIIDYKITDTVATGEDLETWLDGQAQRYRGQLRNYATFLRTIGDMPLKTVLYFPLLQRQVEVVVD
ncbi:MAG: UvrD-helicase domain-containing protein [Burkholderiales bacterium]|jgi:ATP-dependent exoDNAse (exonuclease V) beta subunit|nr:UvrD-helicase domain-containing protein [Burkholderiales bacterium]